MQIKTGQRVPDGSSRVFLGCSGGFPECVPGVFLGCSAGVPWVFRGCSKGVPGVF